MLKEVSVNENCTLATIDVEPLYTKIKHKLKELLKDKYSKTD